MTTGRALKNSKKVYLPKISFIFAISDNNYDHVLKVWEAFKMNNMKDYHDLYLKVDVLLLACVLETFKKESINSF